MSLCRNCNVETDGVPNDSTGDIVCPHCGAVWEENTIVNAVEFSETAGGGSAVIGQYVSATSSKPYGASSGYGQSRDSSEASIESGKREIVKMIARLSISAHLSDPAHRLYMLAVQNKFTHGRRTQHVLAACIYLACRRENQAVLLIDFADTLQANVYVLGTTYLKLCAKLNLDVGMQDPTLYIHRYAARLELGDSHATNAVAQTAQRLIARMKRDWIYTGRRPAGICGACLLIAARIHGFRRTRAEVQQIVRVAEGTLKNRLAEFENTPSSLMTPDEFQRLEMVDETLPPAYIRGLIDDALTTERAMLEDALAQDTAPLALMDMREQEDAAAGIAAEAAAAAAAAPGAAFATLEDLLRDDDAPADADRGRALGSTPGWLAAPLPEDAPDRKYMEAAVRRGALRPSAPPLGGAVTSRKHADMLVSEEALARVLQREPALKQYLDMSLLVSVRDVGPTLSALMTPDLKVEMHRLSKPADPAMVAVNTSDNLTITQGFTADEEGGEEQAVEEAALDEDGNPVPSDAASVASSGRQRRARVPVQAEPLDPLDVTEAATALGRGPLTVDDMRLWKARALLHTNWGRGRGGFDQYRKQYEAEIVRTARTMREARESAAGDAPETHALEDEAHAAIDDAPAAAASTDGSPPKPVEPARLVDDETAGAELLEERTEEPPRRRSARTRTRSTRLRDEDEDDADRSLHVAPASSRGKGRARSSQDATPDVQPSSAAPSSQLMDMVRGDAGAAEDLTVLAAFAAASDAARRSSDPRKRRRSASKDRIEHDVSSDDDDDVAMQRGSRKRRRSAVTPSSESEHDDEISDGGDATESDAMEEDGATFKRRRGRGVANGKKPRKSKPVSGPIVPHTEMQVAPTEIDQAYVNIASQIAADARKAVAGADTALVPVVGSSDAMSMTSPTRLLYDRTRGPSAASVPPSLLVPPRSAIAPALMKAANRNHVMPANFVDGDTTVLPDLSDDDELDDCILSEDVAAERKAVWHELHADYLTSKKRREDEAEKKKAGIVVTEKKPGHGRMQHRRSAASGPEGVRSVLAAGPAKSSKINYAVVDVNGLFTLSEAGAPSSASAASAGISEGASASDVKPRKKKKKQQDAVEEGAGAAPEDEPAPKPRKVSSKLNAAAIVDSAGDETASKKVVSSKATNNAVSKATSKAVSKKSNETPPVVNEQAREDILAKMRSVGSLAAISASGSSNPVTKATPAAAAKPAAALIKAPPVNDTAKKVVHAAVKLAPIVTKSAAASVSLVEDAMDEDEELVHEAPSRGGGGDYEDAGFRDDDE